MAASQPCLAWLMQVGPLCRWRWGWACLLVFEPLFEGWAGVAAVAAEAEVGEAAGAGRLPYPGFGDGEQFGDVACGEEALVHASASVPQLAQPVRGLPRPNSSSLLAFG